MPSEQWFQGLAEELDTGRSGTPFEVSNVREYVRRFRVITKDRRIGPLGVCYCPGIPLPFSFYLIANGLEYDTAALAVRFDAEQENADDWPNWIVTVTYSTEMPPGGAPSLPGTPGGPSSPGGKKQGSQNNPELEPPDVSWDEEILRWTPPYDLDGKAFMNSAKQMLTPSPMFDFPHNVLVVTRNDVAYSPETAVEFAMAYNQKAFMGAPPGCAQCMPFRSKLTFRGPTYYHRTTYRIRFTPKILIPNEAFEGEGLVTEPPFRRITWKDIESTFLDAGTDELVQGPLGVKVWLPIYVGGTKVTQPVALDENGKHIKPEALKSGLAKPHYQKFRVRESKDFDLLFTQGLQTSLAGPGEKYWEEGEL